jgi:CheY-like chemotaxis protein
MVTDSTKRILVVDDDLLIRRMVVTALRLKGLTVDEAENGRAAMSRLHENRYAVVLLDLFMPEIDGFEVLEKIHSDAEVQGPPVVLVVSGADTDSIEQLDSTRIHGVIRKPFEIDDLTALVVACSEMKSRNAFGAMAVATMISGAGVIQWLVK